MIHPTYIQKSNLLGCKICDKIADYRVGQSVGM